MGFSLAAARLLRLRVLRSICFSLLMFPRPCVPMLVRLQSDSNCSGLARFPLR